MYQNAAVMLKVEQNLENSSCNFKYRHKCLNTSHFLVGKVILAGFKMSKGSLKGFVNVFTNPCMVNKDIFYGTFCKQVKRYVCSRF